MVVSDTIKCGAALTAEKPQEKGPEADLFAAAHVMSEVCSHTLLTHVAATITRTVAFAELHHSAFAFLPSG